MAVDADPIGAVGTLVAAGLQTAGMYLQSSLLDVLNSPEGSQIGMFLYVMSAATAIIILALGGNYKFGLWFLLGPAIFYQMITPREIATVTSWQMGQHLHQAKLVGGAVRGVGEGAPTTAGKTVYVSSFFATWDSIVSNTVQTAIRALMITDVKSDLDFLGKAQRYQLVFNADPQNAVINRFVSLVALHPDCVEFLSLKRLEGIDVPEKVWAEHELTSRVTELENRIVVTDTSDSYRFIKESFDQGYFTGVTELEPSYTCGDLYRLAITALRTEARDAVLRIASENKSSGLNSQDNYQELIKKFGEKLDDPNRWDPGDPKTAEAVSTVINMIAVNMFSRTMQKQHPASQKYFLNPGLRQDTKGDPYDPSEDLRFMALSHEYQGKGDYLVGMLALPYLQGVVLFFLAFTFPMFCFVLLIPGRHHTFFWWMGMWLWVKTWDFGFAVVMMLDELLYYLLPRSPVMTGGQAEDPAQAFRLLLQADPTYSVQTYYNLLATCLAAVPIITGFLVKKGGGEVMDAVNQGFTGFGGKIGGSMTSNAPAGIASNLLGQNEREKIKAGQQAMVAAFASEPVRKALKLNMTRAQVDNLISTDAGKKEYLGQVAKAIRGSSNTYQKELVKAQVELMYKSAMVSRSLDDDMVKLSDRAVLMKWYSHEYSTKPAAMWEDYAVAESNYQWGGSMNDLYKQLETRIAGTAEKLVTNGKLDDGGQQGAYEAIFGAAGYANIENAVVKTSEAAKTRNANAEKAGKRPGNGADTAPVLRQIETKQNEEVKRKVAQSKEL